MAKVHFKDEAGRPAWVPVGPEKPTISVGRHKDCDIRTQDTTVSRRHATIAWQDGTYAVEDLGSSNGTFYGGQRVSASELVDGDIFMCGKFELRLELDEYERHQPAPPSVWDDEGIEELPEESFDDRLDVAWSSKGETVDAASEAASPEHGDFAPKTFAGFISKMQQARPPEPPPSPAQVVDLDAEPAHRSHQGFGDDEGIEIEDDLELARLREEVARLKKDLKARETAADRVRIELDSLTAALESARHAERELDEVRAHSAELEAAVTERDDMLKALDEHVVALEARLEETFATVEGPNTNPEGPTLEQLEETSATLERVSAELEEARQRESAAEIDLKRLQAELQAERKGADTDRQAADKLRQRLTALEKERHAALAEREAEVQRLRQADEERAAEIERLRDAEAERAAEIERLRGTEAELTAEIERLQSERATIDPSELDHVRTERDALAEELRSRPAAADHARVVSERDALAAELRSRPAAPDLARLRDERDRVAAERERAMLERDEAQARARTLQQKVDAASQSTAAARGVVDAELTAARTRLEEITLRGREREAELGRQLESARAERERATREVGRLEELLATATASADRALDLMREENAVLRRAHEGVQAEAERRGAELEGQVTALRAELDDTRREADELRRQAEAATSSTELIDLRARGAELLADVQAARDDRGRVESELQAVRQRSEALETQLREGLSASERAHREASARADIASQALDKITAELDDARKAVETARKERAEAEAAARQARDAVAEADKRSGESRKIERELAAAQRVVADHERRVLELSAENENLKLGHKAQTRRVSQLLAELRSARGDQPAGSVNPAELDAANEALARAEQERDALNDRLSRTQKEAADARAREQAQAARVGELEAQLRALTKRLEEAPASTSQPGASNGEAMVSIRPLFERVNDLASVWRNNMTLIDDFIEEMNDPDAAARAEAFEQIGAAVSSCRVATKEMKDALREVRKALHSES